MLPIMNIFFMIVKLTMNTIDTKTSFRLMSFKSRRLLISYLLKKSYP